MAEEDASTGYQNSYGFPYNIGGYGKDNENPVVGTKWGVISKPEHTHFGSSQPDIEGENGSWDHTTYGIRNIKNSVRPSNSLIEHHKPIHHKDNKVDWQKFGMLALMKIGLIKLQAIGFLKVLFILAFKLKLYLKAVFFKFLLILKLMIFFKILILPWFILKLLPIFMQLFSLPTRVIDVMRPSSMTTIPSSNQQQNRRPSTTDIGTNGNIIPSGTTTGTTGGTIGNRFPIGNGGLSGGTSGGLSGGASGGLSGGIDGLGGNGIGGLSGGNGIGGLSGGNGIGGGGIDDIIGGNNINRISGGTHGNRILGGNGLSAFKFDDYNLLDNHRSSESMEIFDPTLAIFQKVLDSEKCVERIACRIAAAEKAGIMPYWINW